LYILQALKIFLRLIIF